MSQDNLLNQNNFQPFHTTKTLYQTDMAMQFAPSVPHRQPSRRVQQQPMSYPSFQNQEQCKYTS
jgi:hypothetical protein